MATPEEQLTELRISFVKNLYKGQPQKVIDSAVKDIHRMNFDSVEEFENFYTERFQDDPNREATTSELNDVFCNMGLGELEEDSRSQEEKDLDNIMKHI